MNTDLERQCKARMAVKGGYGGWGPHTSSKMVPYACLHPELSKTPTSNTNNGMFARCSLCHHSSAHFSRAVLDRSCWFGDAAAAAMQKTKPNGHQVNSSRCQCLFLEPNPVGCWPAGHFVGLKVRVQRGRQTGRDDFLSTQLF